jgi:hypothetical protein
VTEDILYLDVSDALRLYARIFGIDAGAAREVWRQAARR